MQRLRLFFALFAFLTMPVAAATVQQDFDAAQAKLDAQDFTGARDAFTALLARFPPGSKGKAASLVRVKLATALLATNEPEAAIELLDQALPNLKPATPAEAEVEALARFDMGRAHEATGALDSAAGDYRAALALKAFPPASAMDIAMRAGLARTLIWSNPVEARQLLDGLLALPPAQLSGDSRGLVLTLRGRVELNNGDVMGAKRWFGEAATAAGGGASTRVNVADVRIRGDMALAHLLTGNETEAQRFVAMSGAGLLISEGLTMAAERPLPVCAPASGIAPDAVAVIEFGIAPDGRTFSVTPIYAKPGRDGVNAGDDRPEIAFVKAVRDWSWTTDEVAKFDAFWRQAVRVELRCEMPRNQSDAIFESFSADFEDWAKRKGIEPVPEYQGSDALLLPKMRAELARREAAYGLTSVQLVPALGVISQNVAAGGKERSDAIERYRKLLIANGAPRSAIVFVDVRNVDSQALGANPGQHSRSLHDGYTAILTALEASGEANTRIALYIRLRLAAVYDQDKKVPEARAQLRAIVDSPESLLPAGDPIRVAALLRISNQAAAARDTATAASALAATGLAPEQCALIDVQPQAINRSVMSTDFPLQARRWSSEGYVVIAHDITTAGKPANVRTVFAMPPFAFSRNTEQAVERFRFQPVFRPGNKIGCSGATQRVRFRMLER